MTKDKKEKEETSQKAPPDQNIPEEVLRQLPPEVKAQLGYQEEQKPIFRPAEGAGGGLSDSIDRLREGFEKIGLTLIGRMGEFASTLERVVMTVARIEKVEKKTAETTYFLQNLQKTLDGFSRDFGKVLEKIDNIEIDIERIAREIADIKQSGVPTMVSAPTAVALPSVKHTPSTPENPPIKASPPPPTSIKPSEVLAAASSPPTPPETPPTPTQAPLPMSDDPVENIFINLKNNVKVGGNPNTVADLLDQAREKISKEHKWTPALYEVGKLARKLRKANSSLSQDDLNEINQLLDQLRSQIG